MDPNAIAAVAKAVPEVVREAYGDLASSSLKQVGKLGEEIVKTIRLVLFPVQMAAALQDKLEGYVHRAIRQVPEARLIAPMESIIFPTAEKLKFQEDSNPITDLYINLLSRAMDGERVGEAHPAFVGIISQLAPDEVIFLRELSKKDYTLILKLNEQSATPTSDQIERVIDDFTSPQKRERIKYLFFDYKLLNQPEMFYIFLEHLYHLGLVQYINDPFKGEGIPQRAYNLGEQMHGARFIFISLSSFGSLFYKACVHKF